jgi:hypothetical protein
MSNFSSYRFSISHLKVFNKLVGFKKEATGFFIAQKDFDGSNITFLDKYEEKRKKYRAK